MAPHRVSVAILALVMLFMAALIGLRLAALNEERENALASGQAAMRTLALVGDQYAQRVFETSDLVTAQVIARIEALGGVEAVRDSLPMHQWLRDLSERSAGDYLTVVDAAGRPALGSHMHPALREVDVSDRAWFRAHAEGGQSTHIG